MPRGRRVATEAEAAFDLGLRAPTMYEWEVENKERVGRLEQGRTNTVGQLTSRLLEEQQFNEANGIRGLNANDPQVPGRERRRMARKLINVTRQTANNHRQYDEWLEQWGSTSFEQSPYRFQSLPPAPETDQTIRAPPQAYTYSIQPTGHTPTFPGPQPYAFQPTEWTQSIPGPANDLNSFQSLGQIPALPAPQPQPYGFEFQGYVPAVQQQGPQTQLSDFQPMQQDPPFPDLQNTLYGFQPMQQDPPYPVPQNAAYGFQPLQQDPPFPDLQNTLYGFQPMVGNEELQFPPPTGENTDPFSYLEEVQPVEDAFNAPADTGMMMPIGDDLLQGEIPSESQMDQVLGGGQVRGWEWDTNFDEAECKGFLD